MKKIVYIIFMSIIFSNDSIINFKVSGMMCGVGCVKNITDKTMNIEGIKTCSINYSLESMEILFDSSITNEQIIKQKLNQNTNYSFVLKNNKTNMFTTFWNNLFNF